MMLMSFVGLDLNDRDQRHSYITHFFQQAMQSGLICHRSGKKRVAVLFQGDGQAIEPYRPLGIQMSLEADFVEWNG